MSTVRTWVCTSEREMAYLAAIAAGSGVPLFTRTKGDIPSVSLVHQFSTSRHCVTRAVIQTVRLYCDNA